MPEETPPERELSELRKKREALADAHDAIERARKGDESALPAVRRYLDERGPGYLDIVDMALLARDAQIDRVLGKTDLAAREALRRKMAGTRREIVGANPSPLEGLLADRILLCWLQLHYEEIKHAELASGGIEYATDDWHQKRLDRLQRRYLAAIKGLAQVRKLLRPSVQVNIAEQQVNVAGDVKGRQAPGPAG